MDLTLPIPPSANSLTRNVRGKGRVKTQRYMEWINAAGWELQAQTRGACFAGAVSIDIALSKTAKIDLDNACKPTVDLLVRHQVIGDDSAAFVREVRLRWHDGEGLLVHVEGVEQARAA